MPSLPDAIALLRDLAASPRATGSKAIEAARDRVARDIVAAGFARRDIPFEFSAFPGRWATPIFGAIAAGAGQGISHFGSRGNFGVAVAIASAGVIALVAGGRWLARHGTSRLRLLRERGILMEFTRGTAARPRVWLCAHLDTKSQPVPTLLRATGITVTVIGLLLSLSVLALSARVTVPLAWWIALAVVTLVGAIPVMLSVVTNRSVGALDNASGVATVVAAARLLDGRNVGVLITDAEELGLAGARAWADALPVGTEVAPIVLNCDGVDDHGGNVVMHSGTAPRALLARVHAGAAKAGLACRSRRLPVGVLTDSVAFADAGLASVTFSRGTYTSLLRVHTRRDDLARLQGTGIAEVAGLMAATVNELEGWEHTWKS